MDKKLIEKYFSGKCDSKEEAEVVAWLETMKGDLYDLSAIEEAWDAFEVTAEDKSSWDSRLLLQSMLDQIDKETEQGKHVVLPQAKREHHPVNRKVNRVTHHWAGRWFVAATLVLLMLAGAFFWQDQRHLADGLTEEVMPQPTMLTKSTKKGQLATIKLSDGTKVKLNANSTLTFPESFGNTERRVTLVGEAFFEVAHDSLRPFKVLAGDLKTTVLGTSFNVQAYPKSGQTNIALVEGKVCVDNIEKNDVLSDDAGCHLEGSIELNPLEQVVYDKKKAQMLTQPLDEDQIAWRYGELVFKAATMEEIVEKLENWYGVEIEYPERKYTALRFTGKFKNKSLERVMKGIQMTAHFQFELKGKKLKIR